MLPSWTVIFPLFFSTSLAVLVNVTIDDTLGDSRTGTLIQYMPEDAWKVGPECRRCSTTRNPNLSRQSIHNGTWHDGTANKSPDTSTSPLLATVPFKGSAIYVYCIITNAETDSNRVTDMTFLIDSQPAGSFLHNPSGDGTFQYDTLVFADNTLPYSDHILTIQNGNINGRRSLVLLDYIVYTYEDGVPAPIASDIPTPSPPTSSALDSPAPSVNSSGKIVGAVLGSVGAILLVLVAFLWHRQRKSGESVDLLTPSTSRSTHSVINPIIWIGKQWRDLMKLTLPPKTQGIPAQRSNRAGWVKGWWHNANSDTRSRFSFNPGLFVEPMSMIQQNHTISHPPPPPITRVLPIQPLPQRPDSTRPLQPNREATPTPSLDPRTEQSQPLSIMDWQRRTQREADDTPPRFDVTDEEMSSYYDFSSDTPDPPPQDPNRPRPKSTPRRFTVVNN